MKINKLLTASLILLSLALVPLLIAWVSASADLVEIRTAHEKDRAELLDLRAKVATYDKSARTIGKAEEMTAEAADLDRRATAHAAKVNAATAAANAKAATLEARAKDFAEKMRDETTLMAEWEADLEKREAQIVADVASLDRWQRETEVWVATVTQGAQAAQASAQALAREASMREFAANVSADLAAREAAAQDAQARDRHREAIEAQQMRNQMLQLLQGELAR